MPQHRAKRHRKRQSAHLNRAPRRRKYNLDPLRQDDLWLYLPSLRRVRRPSSAQRSEALFGQDIDVDSYGGYAGQIPWFEWKFLGKKPMLASLHGENMPPVPCKGDGGMTFCEAWEKRPEVLIVEGVPKAEAYAFSKRVIYIDHESFFIVYTDLYEAQTFYDHGDTVTGVEMKVDNIDRAGDISNSIASILASPLSIGPLKAVWALTRPKTSTPSAS